MTLKPDLTPCSTLWLTASRRLARERNHQAVQHQVRRLAHVPAILKLPKILRKMLLADMDMRPVNPALNRCPKAFNGVDAGASWRDILFSRMIYCFVIIAVGFNRLVGGMLVSVDDRVGAPGIFDDRQQRIAAATL